MSQDGLIDPNQQVTPAPAIDPKKVVKKKKFRMSFSFSLKNHFLIHVSLEHQTGKISQTLVNQLSGHLDVLTRRTYMILYFGLV